MKLKNIHIRGFSHLSDEDLLEKFKKTKDKRYVAQLYGRYIELIYGLCLRYTPDPKEAEDFCSNVFVILCEKVDKYKIERFRPWLYVLTKNYCLSQLRKVSGKRFVISKKTLMQFDLENHPIVDEPYKEDPNLAKIEPCMEELKPLQKQCITLFYFEHKTYKEIAAIVENEVAQIRSFLQNGRRNLKNCMNRK